MRPLNDVRLFFALWPDDLVRDQISENLKLLDIDTDEARFIDGSNLHLTLHFIGNTSFSEMNCLDQQARLTRSSSFDLTLDCSGFFKKPKVFWFGCLNPPGAIYDLHRKLGRRIDSCAYIPESRPYSPHVTVARKLSAKPEPKPVSPINWQVDQFALIESISISGGVRYEVVKRYALESPTPVSPG